jgi:hypothetical protein
MNVALGKLTLMLSLELRGLICQHSSTMSMLSMRALVEDGLIGIVYTNDLIGLIDPLGWGGTPAIEDWNFLSHILTGFGPTEGKLFFLDTLSWNDASLRELLLHHYSILNWDCCCGNYHRMLLLYVGALTWACSCLHKLRLSIGLGGILLSSIWGRYLELI